MPRSSRHKSSKHSSRDTKEYYSDSDKDSNFKEKEREKEREKEKDKDRDRRTKDSGSGDKRKLDYKDTSRDLFSPVNGEHSGDYASSKRRKERANDGVGERRSGGAGDDDSRAEKASKLSSESKSKKREEVEGDEYKKSRSEGKHRESSKKEERKSREIKSEKLIDEGERRTAKQVSEITDVDVKEQLLSLESQSQLEKRSRKRRDGSGDGHKHQEENGETVDRHLLSKNEAVKDERSKDEKYKDDYWEVTDKEDRYRDEIHRDERSRDRSDARHAEKHLRDERDVKEAHRKSKNQEADREHGHDRERGRDRQRENDSDRGHGRESDRDTNHHGRESDRDTNRHDHDYDRHRDRDHYRDRDRSRDVDHDREQGRRHERRERNCDHEQERHDNDGDRDRDQGRDRERGSQLDERNVRHRDRRGRKRSPDDLDDGSDIKPRVLRNHYAQLETKWSCTSASKMESDAERERSMSRSAYADAALGGNRRSPPSSSYYVDNDEHKQLKQEDSKYMSEQRSKSSSKEGTGFSSVPDRGSRYRSMEKSNKTDDANAAELPAERSSSSKASPMGFKERSPSSTRFERRYAKSPGVRHGLDVEDAAWKGSSTPVATKESYVTEDKKMVDLPSDRPHLDEASQTDSVFHNRATPINFSLIPPPLSHRSGHANPSFRGPLEEDNRSNNARYKRSGDLITGRGPGSAWRGVPNWPSPLPNGFIPFHHGPPHGGFQAMMPQFPSPSMFGVRPSMDMNHSRIPFHIPDGERFSGHMRPIGWQNMIDGTGPSHLHGWDGNNVAFRDETHMFAGSEWDQNRNQISGQGWDTNVEMWKGQNGEVDLSLISQKEDHPAQVRSAEVSEGPESQKSPCENSESEIQVKNLEIGSNATSPAKGSSKSSPEILLDKTAEHPDTLTSDDNAGASPCCIYLSKLDISTELANPDVYAQCMSLLDDQQSDSLLKASKVLVNLKDGGRAVLKASITRLNPSFVPSADTSVFQKAMGLYKKQREASNGIATSNARALQYAPVADVKNREEKATVTELVGEREEPALSDLQMADANMQDLNGDQLDVSAAGSLEKSEDLVSEHRVEPSSDDAGELPERVEVMSPDFARESTEESTQNFDGEGMDEMMSNNAITEDVHGDSLESLDNGNILDQVKETESTH